MAAPMRKKVNNDSMTPEEKEEREKAYIFGQAVLKAMAESAKAVRETPVYDFSCVTPLFEEGK